MDKAGSVRHGGGGGGDGGGGEVIRLPPGFRFHPTDEELVLQYLRRKAFCCPLPASIIPDIELSRHDPWDLPGDAGCFEKERYFFNHREAKYRNGNRSSRATVSGYWKATGRDKQIMKTRGKHSVGMKKVLVFYMGKPPHGTRTNWVMHEYRLAGVAAEQLCIFQQKKNSAADMDWVLCRVFQKKSVHKNDGALTNQYHHNNEVANKGAGFIDFMGLGDSDPADAEASCVTEIVNESGSEEEVSCHSNQVYDIIEEV